MGFDKAKAATINPNVVEDTKNALEVGFTIMKFFHKINEYLKTTTIAEMSVDLLTKLYEIFMMVLLTPLFIFNNTYLTDATLTFSGISVLIVTILTMIEGFKRKFKKKHVNMTQISKRWSMAVAGSCLAPFAFEQVFTFLNYVTKAISNIGSAKIQANNLVHNVFLNQFHTLTLVGFDLIILALMIPIFLQNGRRFFDLMCLSSITPLALSAWVFDEHRHYFRLWWNNVKKLSLVQLVYAVFICIMGIFIFGTQNTMSPTGLLLKMLVIIGGLLRLASVPNFIQSKLDHGEDVIQMGNRFKKTAIDVGETVTLKKFDPLYQAKKKVAAKVISKFTK